MNPTYDTIMTIDTYASLPMNAKEGSIAYARDVKKHYMFDSMNWILVSDRTQAQIDASVATKTAVRYCDNGTFKNGTPNTGDIIIFTDSVTTSGGSATFYPTSNRTSTGTALCSYISGDSFQPNYRDSSGVYTPGAVTVAGNLKSISQTFGKQTFVGLVVLGLNVLGSASNPAIPDGVTVKATWWGIAV